MILSPKKRREPSEYPVFRNREAKIYSFLLLTLNRLEKHTFKIEKAAIAEIEADDPPAENIGVTCTTTNPPLTIRCTITWV
jgi:hypothetical protein